jgi:hypothetical protein
MHAYERTDGTARAKRRPVWRCAEIRCFPPLLQPSRVAGTLPVPSLLAVRFALALVAVSTVLRSERIVTRFGQHVPK